MRKNFIVLEKFKQEAYFRECIYDTNPDVGTYTRDIQFSFIKGNTISCDDNNRIDAMMDSDYGVSMHGSTVYFCPLDVTKLTEKGIIQECFDKNLFDSYQNVSQEITLEYEILENQLKDIWYEISFMTENMSSDDEQSLEELSKSEENIKQSLEELSKRQENILQNILQKAS